VALSKLNRLTGAKEFHFVDIYGGRRAFKGVDPSIRIELFEDMATISTTTNCRSSSEHSIPNPKPSSSSTKSTPAR
jgi:hypothetical protein